MEIGELRFLVVEDHGFQRWVMGNLLSNLGARHVLSAPDGLAALEMFNSASEPIDIIVSDLDMPGMDGMEFIRHVGETRMPVSLILTSALERQIIDSVETMTKAYGVNVLGAIKKPPSSQKLRAAIELHRPAAPGQGAPMRAQEFTREQVAEGLRAEQFEPFFQPKVDMASGRIRGAEALARWRHPLRGIVNPGAFVGLLEESGQIDDLTWLMARKAAQFCRVWQAADSRASVSINLSLQSLSDLTLGERFTELVLREGVEPRQITIEVTETTAATDLGKALENLSRLRMKGFGLSIDDYGTGYSSMQQLTRVAFTELKVDQSFVRHAHDRPTCRAMLESSIEMARRLDIVAVAEGVETRSEWDMLRLLGCDVAQGYFIASPMSAAAFLGWARDWKPLA
jgi:EAL domain-containing protein (putative c-di-GMP-specific phosphodiesterase class I)/FixJ family two-component response regulator